MNARPRHGLAKLNAANSHKNLGHHARGPKFTLGNPRKRIIIIPNAPVFNTIFLCTYQTVQRKIAHHQYGRLECLCYGALGTVHCKVDSDSGERRKIAKATGVRCFAGWSRGTWFWTETHGATVLELLPGNCVHERSLVRMHCREQWLCVNLFNQFRLQAGKTSAEDVVRIIGTLRSHSQTFKALFDNVDSESAQNINNVPDTE